MERFETVRTADKRKLFRLELDGKLNSNMSERLGRKIVRNSNMNCLNILPHDRQELTFYLNHNTKTFYLEVVANLGLSERRSQLEVAADLSPKTKCQLIGGNNAAIVEKSGHSDLFVHFLDPFVAQVDQPVFESTSSNSSNLTVFAFVCDLESNESRVPLSPADYLTKKVTITVEGHEELGLCGLRLFDFEPFKCGLPEIPLNGQIYEHFDDDNATPLLQYICHEDFELVSDPSYKDRNGLECGLDGRWIGSFPSCRPQLTCSIEVFKDEPSGHLELELANYVHWNRAQLAVKGSTASFSCRGGLKWTLIGDRIQTCTRNGTWSSDLPQCLILSQVNSSNDQYQLEPVVQKNWNINSNLSPNSWLRNSALVITIATLLLFSIASLIVITLLYRRLIKIRSLNGSNMGPKIITAYSFQNMTMAEPVPVPRPCTRPPCHSEHYESLVGLDYHRTSSLTTNSNVYDDVMAGANNGHDRRSRPLVNSDYLEVIGEEVVGERPIYANCI